jgi:hypothetical protein
MLRATCHCGDVQIEVSEMPDSLTQCNCSICRRYGALWAYFTIDSATVTHAKHATSVYIWNDKDIEFVHCKTCGCLTHYEDTDKTGSYRVAVNARMMDPLIIEEIGIRVFDGASM